MHHKIIITIRPNNSTMRGKDVKRLYAIGNARWYDLFKRLWNWIIVSRAEKELHVFLAKNVDKNKTVLELGCGTAANLETMQSLGLHFKEYRGLDFSKDMLSVAKSKFRRVRHVQFEQRDITSLDGIHKKYDIIICTWGPIASQIAGVICK
ncbi:class I SAM-dependent methyltransferase [Candidatus Woesearchaeota archaeon]|nr:class I SAM-dependent methyltransferase [Candidatus Woesearchaeota archaeon]